jgi:hypothetical protein
MHFHHSRLEFFPENCGVLSDELGERFHYICSGEEIPRKVDFIDVSNLLLDGNKRGEETA